MRGTYTRCTRQGDGPLSADILGSRIDIEADPSTGQTTMTARGDGGEVALTLDPDTARMIGVRLIEAASLADAGRAVRTITWSEQPHP